MTKGEKEAKPFKRWGDKQKLFAAKLDWVKAQLGLSQIMISINGSIRRIAPATKKTSIEFLLAIRQLS
jgi:hypothetical protein